MHASPGFLIDWFDYTVELTRHLDGDHDPLHYINALQRRHGHPDYMLMPRCAFTLLSNLSNDDDDLCEQSESPESDPPQSPRGTGGKRDL